jgi:hypothetical protein
MLSHMGDLLGAEANTWQQILRHMLRTRIETMTFFMIDAPFFITEVYPLHL